VPLHELVMKNNTRIDLIDIPIQLELNGF